MVDGPGQIGRCVDVLSSRLVERETFVGICNCSRRAHAFVGWWIVVSLDVRPLGKTLIVQSPGRSGWLLF